MNDRRGHWDQSTRAGGPAPLTSEAMRGVCFCLLYDLCCWLASVRRPVPTDVEEYTLGAVREIADPRQRLGRYVNGTLLLSWEQALEPFFAPPPPLEQQVKTFQPLNEEQRAILQSLYEEELAFLIRPARR